MAVCRRTSTGHGDYSQDEAEHDHRDAARAKRWRAGHASQSTQPGQKKHPRRAMGHRAKCPVSEFSFGIFPLHLSQKPARTGHDRIAGSILSRTFRGSPGRACLPAARGYRSESFTYGEIMHMALAFAGEMRARGIQKGDRVMLWGENSAEWVAAFFGCAVKRCGCGSDGRWGLA